jgi:hypothetical protein
MSAIFSLMRETVVTGEGMGKGRIDKLHTVHNKYAGNNFNCRHGPTCVAGVVADEHILASREWNKERKEENILNSIILPQSAIKKCDEITRAYV